jgi:hypothetical protein
MWNKKLPLSMKQPDPVLVVDLFPSLQTGLVDLLASLSGVEWEQPIRYSTWTVREVALHLLGGEIGNLSRRRDGYTLPAKHRESWRDRVNFINELNDQWLIGARRISPHLLCDLLAFTAPQLFAYFKSLDPFAVGASVSWAGSEPAPVWLDIAREYTERWYHQQQIRDAVGKPGFKQPQYFAPVLATFVHALPKIFQSVSVPDGTVVTLILTGDSGGTWCVSKETQAWRLYAGTSSSLNTQVSLDQDIAWRLFTKGIGKEEALSQATLIGDKALGMKIFDAVSIIA